MRAAGPDTLAGWAALDGGVPAVIEGGRVITRAQLDAEADRLAGGLAALGLRGGDRAAWCGQNSAEVVTVMHACRRLGLVAVPMSYRFTADEFVHVLSDSGAAAVLVDARHAEPIAGLLARLPELRLLVSFGGEPVPGFLSWEEVTAFGPLETPPAATGPVMLYTSGTTGRPKGAVRSRSDAATLAAMMAALDFGSAEVHLVTGPLYHAGPHSFAMFTHGTGGTVVVTPRFEPAEWVRLVGAHRVTSAFVSPVHLKRVVGLPEAVLATADVSSLRSVIVDTAPVPYALKQEVLAKLGEGFLYEVYGSTELGIATVLAPRDQLRKPGSCGQPYGDIGLRVVGDDGVELAAGQAGELFVRTPQAIDRYHGPVPQLRELPGGEGWKSVGDVASIDEEGYLSICDRKTDMVISGGMNVYPAEVEAVLHGHPDVADVAVIGVPDDEWGERVHAVVVAKPGCRLRPPELDAFVAGQLANFKRPRSWDLRAELPRTESGKLLKRVLRDEHRAAQGGPR
ncbi:MAG TPA: AMP-binding protein [Acidimicrobiales bacterium]|nr:AMP-binding protein [Acidimicrobiales bacterium]